MKLKKLTIQGFKSFADKISIDFDCEIVGIVGPNGCGKSNIVDAFRWVLGEQSAKSLRGDKMHDVLFAGTDTRSPLNLAEASVTLSEINGELPIAYDEITITRRLYRNGDSEYLINKQPVRLKDVHDLFLGSGIGKNTFSVFEQGKLDQVIHLSPVDRRSIFDEAAGIGRFLQRKRETVRKLAQVGENYVRVRDIHQEVEKQTKQLKKQAAHAKNFQENKERLEGLERALLVTRLRTLTEKHHDVEGAASRLGEEVKEEHHRLAASLEHIEAIKKELKERDDLAKSGRLLLHKAETEVRVKEAEGKQQKHQLSELEKKIATLKGDKEATERRGDSLVKQIEEKKESLAKALEQKNSLEKLLEGERSAYDGCEKEMLELRRGLKVARESHLSALQEEGRLQRELQEKTLRSQAIQQRIAEKIESQALLKIESTQKQKEVKALLKGIEELKKVGDGLENERGELRQSIREKQEALQECQKGLTGLKARQQALLRLKEACEGFSNGTKELLKNPKVRGLCEVLKPSVELMPALHIYAQTLAVTTQKDLDDLLDLAEKKQLSDYSVVLLEKGEFLEGLPPVTKRGFYVDHKGVIFHVNMSRKEGNPFLREAELESLATSIALSEKELKKGQKELESIMEKLKGVEERLKEISEKRRREEMVHVQENFSLQRTLADLQKGVGELAILEKEQSGLANLESLTQLFSQKQQQCATLLKDFKAHEERVEAHEVTLQSALRKWQEAQGLFQKAFSLWQHSDQEFKMLKSNEEQSLRTHKKISTELEEIQQLTIQIKGALERSAKEGEELKGKLQELEKSASSEDNELEKCRSKREELEKHVAQKRTALGILEKRLHHLELARAEDASRRKGIEQELLERHHLTLEEITSSGISLISDLEEAEKQVRSLRLFLDRAGAVNMTAIKEYQEQESRFQELDRQLVDLEEAKNDLEKIISKLDTECRKIFKETFETIRENFKKNFAILFNGGEANLTFTESPDVLEAGVEIVAKPPGKQMRSISLLSGGEKCLTALALLFSIFEVRPAPFCILDEVDAPLDDSNIDRFTAVLKQYIEKTQFIVVTHNKKTMAIAGLLLGVSMEEKGISKLLSLSFERQFAGKS